MSSYTKGFISGFNTNVLNLIILNYKFMKKVISKFVKLLLFFLSETDGASIFLSRELYSNEILKPNIIKR